MSTAAISCRDFAITQINTLPEEAVKKVIEFISFQKFNLGLEYESDTDYLYSIPGLVEKIKEARKAPAEEWEDVPEELFNV
jgi:hypothetical protein